MKRKSVRAKGEAKKLGAKVQKGERANSKTRKSKKRNEGKKKEKTDIMLVYYLPIHPINFWHLQPHNLSSIFGEYRMFPQAVGRPLSTAYTDIAGTAIAIHRLSTLSSSMNTSNAGHERPTNRQSVGSSLARLSAERRNHPKTHAVPRPTCPSSPQQRPLTSGTFNDPE